MFSRRNFAYRNSASVSTVLHKALVVGVVAVSMLPVLGQTQIGSTQQQHRIDYDNAGLDRNFDHIEREHDEYLRCPQDTIPVPVLPSDDGRPITEYPIELEADEMGAEDGNTVVLSGAAEIVQGNQAIKADKLIYRKEEDRLDAVGEVVIYTPFGDRIEADRLDIELETFIGEADNPRFRISERDSLRDRTLLGDQGSSAPTLRELLATDDEVERAGAKKQQAKEGESFVRARGHAEKVFFEGHDLMRLEQVEYTTCLEGQDDVIISASQVELDKADNVGIARNVRLKFMDVPIFYFPYLSFPISSERKTGFLFPGIGRQDDAGIVLEAPWYWNIAPNIDATFVPRYYEKRGTQLSAELRYMTETSTGQVRGEILPDDDLFEEGGEDRSAFAFRHEQNFSDRLVGRLEYEDASDRFYFDDFDTDVDITSSTHLPRFADLSYYGDYWQLSGRFTEYQTLDEDTIIRNRPYERLPQINLASTFPLTGSAFELGFNGEWTNFERDESVTGTRLDLTPSISLPLREVYGFVIPRLGYRYTNYSLDGLDSTNGAGDSDDVASGTALTNDSPSRSVPVVSVDSGLFFERNTRWRGTDHIQTLEPRLFYTYIPEEDQDDIPVFDTSEVDLLNFSDIFRENRFFGADRVGDTSQLTVALTTRLLDDVTGIESLEASIGQILYLKDRTVTLEPVDSTDNGIDDTNGESDDLGVVDDTELTRSTSDFIAQLNADFTDHWGMGSFLRYDTEESEIAFGRLDLNYEVSTRKQAELSYYYNGDASEELDFKVAWPLSAHWDFRARERYDLDRNEHQETTLSLGYDACCWGIDFTYQRRVARNDEYKNSFFIVFELTGLGRLRSAF